MSQEPVKQGPFHPAMDRLSVKFGPYHEQIKFSSPETVEAECILMNMGYAKAQATLMSQPEKCTLERCVHPHTEIEPAPPIAQGTKEAP